MAEHVYDVLVVEDDAALRQQTVQLLELWGYHARAAEPADKMTG